MKRFWGILFVLVVMFVFSLVLTPGVTADKAKQDANQTGAGDPLDDDGQDPDLPPHVRGIDKELFLKKRDEQIARMRGVEPGQPFDPTLRQKALDLMQRQQKSPIRLTMPEAIQATWIEVGPNPIPNGQTSPVNPVSGRVTAIEINPTNPNLVYVGTAQGGVFRSSDGGTNWTPIFDLAQSLAIGSLALAPSNPEILFVGTGEANSSADCYAGVGIYRIDNASTTNGSLSDLQGPINPQITATAAVGGSLVYKAFNGRTISKILVLPSDPSTLFVGVANGVIGIGGESPFGNTIPPLGLRGLYKLTNATSAPASVVATRIGVRSGNGFEGCFDSPCTGNRNVNDIVFDPNDATGNTIILWLNGTSTANDGGIWRTTNAMAATPSFTQTLSTTAPSPTTNVRGVLAIYKPAAGPAVVYGASGEDSTGTNCTSATQRGALRRSVDGGVTWSSKLLGGGGFCGGQCSYNLGLAVVAGATTALDKLLIGGNTSSSSCQRLEATSVDGGATFSNTNAGLHADTHAIRIAPSNNNIVYRGDDGGIWKSTDGGATWSSMNTATFRATQFSGISLHPSNRDFSIGGTQDNGTDLLRTGPTWLHIDNGDGGFTIIDQNAVDTTNVVMYHTYFNSSNSLIGYAEGETATGGFPNFRGCVDGTTPANGITCSDAVNFYAPLVQGPGSPNTVYYGTDRLYRSADKGVTNTIVSQNPIVSGVPLSTIAISPQDDNYRLVGLDNGALFYTATGSSTLTSLDAVGAGSVIPDRYIARVMFDPTNKNIAYITLGGFANGTTAANSHLWRVTNFDSTPAIAAINGSGVTVLPDVPINSIAIDPINPNHLYVATDIGVYFSSDQGASWNPFGTGLPRVAVFDIAIQSPNRVVRIATHGRGMWEIPTAQGNVTVQSSTANYNVNEGDGFVTITITRSGDTASVSSSVDFSSADGTAVQNSDYELASGTLTFAPGETSKTFQVLIVNDAKVESNETFTLVLSSVKGAFLGSPSTATVTIIDNDSPSSTSPVAKQFVAYITGAQEVPATANAVQGNGGVVQLNQSETSALVSLKFSGITGSETGAHIHGPAGPGVNAPILFPLPTTNPVTDFTISPTAQQVADLKAGMHYMNVHSSNFISGEIRGQLLWNPLEEASFFVAQQYYDFLNRTPDDGGLAYWISQITQCNSGVQCLRTKRVDVSNAFYFELEYQQTGSYTYRLYRAAYGNNQPFPNPDNSNMTEAKKLPSYSTFAADRARISTDALAQTQLALATTLVQRPEFATKYPPSLSTAGQFVDAVLATIQSDSSADLNSQRQALIDQYNNAGGGPAGRAMVMYRISDDNVASNPINNRSFIDAEYNRAFVVTQYFGYLRRDPDIGGFLFWLGQVNSGPLRDGTKQHGMVCSFTTSAEYQLRFGSTVTRTNQECL